MAINVRNTLVRVGLESDHHYNDLRDNEILTKQQFSSGVHEVIADPLSNTNATREFYQLSILTATASTATGLAISDSNMTNIANATIIVGDTDSEIAGKLATDLEADNRFANVIRNKGTINFNTAERGRDNILTLTNGTKADTDTNTNIKWRIDVLQEASDANVHSEIVLDAGIWVGDIT